MAITDKCTAAIQAAAKELGREKLTKAELADIDSRLRGKAKFLASTDPEWSGLSRDEKTMRAAQGAMEDVKARAAKDVENAKRQIIATAATETRLGALHEHSRAGKLSEDINQTQDYIHGIKNEAMGGLVALMDAVKSYAGAGLGRRVAMFALDVENPGMTRDLTHEIFANADGHTGNKIAQAGAKAWLSTIETMRQRFNSAGGDVGKLEYGYLPQAHSADLVRKAGREAWVNKTLGQLDRRRYVDENGRQLDDAGMRDLLGSMYETISTEGMNKMTPGEFHGTGARANRGAETREIHFRDGDSYLAYMHDFGRGSMYDQMTGHVGRLARDTGLIERYGPNPEAQMRLQFETAAQKDGTQVTNLKGGVKPQTYWSLVNGAASTPQSARLADNFAHVRNVETMGKLGAAVVSSITDLPTYFQTAGYLKLGYFNALANIGRVALDKDLRRQLTAHGVIAETMAGDMNRWTSDNIKGTWSGRLANSVLKLSLLNAWTDTLRRSFSLTLMQGLARMAGKGWDDLSQWDRGMMQHHGLTAEDWASIHNAPMTKLHGVDHLTPEAIRANGGSSATVSKVLGMIQDEGEYAVLNPDLRTKAITSFGGLQRGTWGGELARSMMQFKSFPIAMVSRHWGRMLDAPVVTDGSAPLGLGSKYKLANRAMYAGSLMVSTTILGAIALQAKQVLAGKDPIDATGPHALKFWAKSVSQGGGLSIMGDMILNDPGNSVSDAVSSTLGTLAGPAGSDIAKAAMIPIETAWKRAEGKPTQGLAQTLNLVRSDAPYVNMWYLRAAVDHAGMQALQENLSPGYLGRVRASAQQQWGQQYWLPPGGGVQRAPNLGKAAGQ